MIVPFVSFSVVTIPRKRCRRQQLERTISTVELRKSCCIEKGIWTVRIPVLKWGNSSGKMLFHELYLPCDS